MDEIGIINISDIHLGHNKNNTKDIIENILKMINNNKMLIKKKVKLLLLTGDEFDRLLTLKSNDSLLAMSFFLRLAKLCKDNDIIIRCIEGTNSHSYNQMKIIGEAIEESNIGVDFKYISNLEIEYISKLDINVLYVPDELNGNNASKTIKQVRSLLKSKKLEKVDIALMHGAFQYQLPAVLESNHVESDYLELVKHYIFIGHVHSHTVYKRIIATGSPDRLKHGEEEDKGIIFAIINKRDIKKDMYKFIVNADSKLFNTIIVKEDNFKDLLTRIHKTLKNTKADSHIRFSVEEKNNIIRNNISELKKLFPKLNFTEDKIEKKSISIFNSKITKSNEVLKAFSINNNNIIDLINDKIRDKLTGEDFKILNKELKDLL